MKLTTENDTEDSRAENCEAVRSSELGMPLRKTSRRTMMAVLAATVAIGSTLGLPMGRAEEKPRELTKHDHERLLEAELKRQRRAAKKAENQRRADEGKRHTAEPSDAGNEP